MQTELHRHLDVSIRTSTLLRLAQERGLEPQSTRLESFREKLILRKPMGDLNQVLSKFALFQHVLDRPDVMEQVAFEAVEDCAMDGTTQVEFRFSPGWVCELSHLAWIDALDGFERGLARARAAFPGVKTGLICIASRDYGVDAVDESVEFYLKYADRFVGLDLAGNEADFPCHLFEESFQKALAKGANITIHAGEASGPENIWEAAEQLGARRIGHGISAIRDPLLMRYLAERKICLEMCPTSNWITGAVASVEEHPLPLVLRSGVPVCINTDDPGIFGVTLTYEQELCRTRMGLKEADIQRCNEYALASSFLPAS